MKILSAMDHGVIQDFNHLCYQNLQPEGNSSIAVEVMSRIY